MSNEKEKKPARKRTGKKVSSFAGHRIKIVGNEKHDPVNHPTHYTAHPSGVECIQITEHMNFCIGNAIKYLWRADLKNGIEDLRKAAWYVNQEIERRQKEPPSEG